MPRFALALLWTLVVACGDSDGDGLGGSAERDLGTNPHSADSDGDGVADGAEGELGTDPTLPDTDGDGLGDGVEEAFGSDPTLPDSDDDGLDDLTELRLGTNVNARDTDADGLDDNAEVLGGTDPGFGDSDSDGISDGDEVEVGSDPAKRDTDGDGLLDGAEREVGTNLLVVDTDGDGFGDGTERFSGSDPNNRDIWPYHDGVWPDRSVAAADKLTPVGWQPGEVALNAQLTDQAGQPFQLHQLFGYIIRLDLVWAGDPTSDAVASRARVAWEDRREQGVVQVHVVFPGGDSEVPIAEVVSDWARRYGLEFPVTSSADGLDVALAQAGLFGGDQAVTVLIDRRMVVVGAFLDDEAGYEAALAPLL